MKLHDLNPRPRRRFARTTDSDHDGPIHPLVVKGFETHAPDQLWVGDITFVAVATGFVYVAIVLDAWSRRPPGLVSRNSPRGCFVRASPDRSTSVGYAIGRHIDARLVVAAFKRAIALRRPLPGCVMHTDRGSQYASKAHRALVSKHSFVGSMSRRGNPYDTPQARVHKDAEGRGGVSQRV